MASSLLWNDQINQKYLTVPNGSKPHYKGPEISHTYISHGEKDITVY